jgi:hypothetical protein
MTLFCRNRGIVGLSFFCAALVIHARPAVAQAGFELGPVIGYYSAIGSERSTDGPNAPGEFSAPAYGGELIVWIHGRFGVQAQSALAWADRQEFTNPGGFESPLPGHTVFGGISAMFDLDPSHPHQVWISAGPGFVHHGGKAFDSSGSPTELAAILGIGAAHSITEGLRVTCGVSTMLYQYTGMLGITSSGAIPYSTKSIESRSRNDVVLHLGLTVYGHS